MPYLATNIIGSRHVVHVRPVPDKVLCVRVEHEDGRLHEQNVLVSPGPGFFV